MLKPFDQSGIARDAQGIARYQNRPASLVAMLRRTVDSSRRALAVAEWGGNRATYQELWDSAARIAVERLRAPESAAGTESPFAFPTGLPGAKRSSAFNWPARSASP